VEGCGGEESIAYKDSSTRAENGGRAGAPPSPLPSPPPSSYPLPHRGSTTVKREGGERGGEERRRGAAEIEAAQSLMRFMASPLGSRSSPPDADPDSA
jgi:hypothetical protein